MMSMEEGIISICQQAKAASSLLAKASTPQKNDALLAMSHMLSRRKGGIARENRRDMKKAKERGLRKSLIDRLLFDEERIMSRVSALEHIAALPDPVGNMSPVRQMPSGLRVAKMRVPLGVIAMIYEARPHVTVNAGAFSLKSGNAAILRGGSEAANTNLLLGSLWREALEEVGLPQSAIQVLPPSGHEAVEFLLKQSEYIDLVIPRGGKELIKTVAEKSTIPVIKHYQGICHVYVDDRANLEHALNISLNSKLLMPEVCNAMETLLIAEGIAPSFLPQVVESFHKEGVELKGCDRAREIVPELIPATEEDWSTEYLDKILSIKVVKDVDEAIAHIATYGSQHTDAIVTEDYSRINRFLREVDSAVVLVNASTMFDDGEELGLGAEVGISTERMHARGPMGLEELTSYKWLVWGEGQVKT
jgi:glutamate-5-semialdehyde dehydrogenase